MDNKSLNKEPLLEWANFIDEAHKDDEAYVNIKSNHLFTNEEYEELLCEKYGLDKDDWTIVSDFDLLENYIKKKFIVCNSCGVIRYYADYDEKEKKYPAADAKGFTGVGPSEPNSKAKFAVFSLDIDVNGNGILFCLFEKNEDSKEKPWTFKQFISSSESGRWFNNLPKIKEDAKPTLKRLGSEFDVSKLQSSKMTNLTFNIDHVKKEGHIERFLPKEVIDLFNIARRKSSKKDKQRIDATINDLIEIFIYDNIKLLNMDECLCGWAISDLEQKDYVPVNLFFPFRLKGRIYAAMVVRITAENEQPVLATIFDLRMAYTGAKLYYAQKLSSGWLTIENVRKELKKINS